MRTLTKLLILLLLCGTCYGAQIIRYVDTDSPAAAASQDGTTWATAYDGIAQFHNNEVTDLDAANNYMTVYCRASAGTADSNGISLAGWTTSAADYLEFIGTDFPADGIFDATKYRVYSTASSGTKHGFSTNVHDGYYRKLQIHCNWDGTATGYAMPVGGGPGGTSHLDSLIIKQTGNTSANPTGIWVNSGSHSLTIYNCTVYGFGNVGIYCYGGSGATHNIYNCTVWDCSTGIARYGFGGNTTNAYNCISANNTSDISGLNTVDYCASDDGAGTNSLDAVSGDWDNELNDANNGDFSLVITGNCYDGGTDDPSSGVYSDDIVDDSRTSTWSVGAYEGALASGGQVIRVIMTKVFQTAWVDERILCLW